MIFFLRWVLFGILSGLLLLSLASMTIYALSFLQGNGLSHLAFSFAWLGITGICFYGIQRLIRRNRILERWWRNG